jgi:hypothetical protein
MRGSIAQGGLCRRTGSLYLAFFGHEFSSEGGSKGEIRSRFGTIFILLTIPIAGSFSGPFDPLPKEFSGNPDAYVL